MTDLTEFRAAKDDFFRSDPDSPLLESQRAHFGSLDYYEERPGLVFSLAPEVFDEQERIELQTSTGTVASYWRWARVRFEVDGQDAELTIYRDDASGGLFLPFVDARAGAETYGAGRYLDLHPLEDGRLLVDFNYAYNPYCAYNERWTCPIPPAENRLDVAITAGERVFANGH
ncbi:MAG: DUF1684 domain-containing protein [Chloroflexi bacterium]|nr:DUF1684 domain-containing protein [Chloroflexota bacterium]